MQFTNNRVFQGRIQELRKGRSKIKFMNGGGDGRGRGETWGTAPAAFLVGMKIKALFTMILFLKNLTFGLATLKKGYLTNTCKGNDEKTLQPPHLDSTPHLYESASMPNNLICHYP